jgi:APA family basic amino acid/polyamine antiporter
MGADGSFLPALGRLHPRFKTPVLAIVLQAVWGIILVLTGTYGELVDSVVFGDWIFFGLTVAAVFRFRSRFPFERRDAGAFRLPGHPVVPALFVAAALLVVASAIRTNPKRSAIGAALLAAGIPVYVYFERRRRSET